MRPCLRAFDGDTLPFQNGDKRIQVFFCFIDNPLWERTLRDLRQ